MADYCGGEVCCPTKEYSLCVNCGETLIQYARLKTRVGWFHHGDNQRCPGSIDAVAEPSLRLDGSVFRSWSTFRLAERAGHV